MDLPFDKEKLKSLFDHVYDPGLTITEVICKLKEQGITQGADPLYTLAGTEGLKYVYLQ